MNDPKANFTIVPLTDYTQKAPLIELKGAKLIG